MLDFQSRSSQVYFTEFLALVIVSKGIFIVLNLGCRLTVYTDLSTVVLCVCMFYGGVVGV